MVQSNLFFCRNSKNVLMQRIVHNPIKQQVLLQQFHDKSNTKNLKTIINKFKIDMGERIDMKR